MEESIEHSPNQQRRNSVYQSMVRKRHSRVWKESSERSVSSSARKLSVDPVESCPVTAESRNLIYFDVNSERIELTDVDPLAQSMVLEKANQVPREPVVQPSQEFLRNVRNKFVKIGDVIEPEDVTGFEEINEPVQVKLEPAQPTTSKAKANYSYTQFDLDTQMIDILEGADMLAGLRSCPGEQELKEWSSPAKPEVVKVLKNDPLMGRKSSKRRSKVKRGRRSNRYNKWRQSSFSRDLSTVFPDCSTNPADLSASIMLDFESDSDADFTVDYSRILSTPLRRRLIQIQNHIESPPQQVNRASIQRTFSRRRKSPEVVVSPQTPPAVVRRLSMESKISERNELSSDEELAATQIDPDRLVPLEPSPEKENFDASLLIKANINQLSQFFSQTVEIQDKSRSTSEPTPSREASFHTVQPMPSMSSPISISPTGSPRTLNIEWLFRSETESELSESDTSGMESSCESSQEKEEQEAIEEVVSVKVEPDEALHRMLDDDDEFLVQLPATQKEVVPVESVEEKVEEKVEVGNGRSSVKRSHSPFPFIEPTRPSVDPEPSTSFANAPPIPTTFGGGFQTASGSGIRVSAASLAKARSIWREEDAKLARDESWQKMLALEEAAASSSSEPVPGPTPAIGGFQTARGGTIKISKEELAKAETRLQQVEREVESGQVEEPMSFGFKTAKGGGIAIPKEALEKAQRRQQQFELYEEGTCADQPVSFGFKTAKGGGIAVSKEALAKAQLRQQQFELEVETASNTKAGENSVLSRAQKILPQVEHERESGFGQPRRKAFNPPGQKAIETPDNSTSKRLPDDELDPETPLKRPKPNQPPHLTSFSTSTPNLTAAARRPEQPVNPEMADFFNDLDDSHFHELFCEETEPAPIKDRRTRPPLKQVRLASRFEECEEDGHQQRPGSAQWDDSFGELVAKLSSDGTLVRTTALKVAQQVLDARRLARERQRECGDSRCKPEQDRRSRLYEFVKRKKQQTGRISLRRLVGGKRVSGVEGGKVAERIRLLSVENVAEFNFEAEAFYGKHFAQENTTGIPLGDPDAPIHLILDDNCHAGLKEFTSAFLAAPGIDPALVPSGWIENAWKWILLKLASLERQLPQHFGDVTSPENVLNQLLFRYHVEIDCAKRSVVRKMLEKDDVPGKRMVLFVSRIFRGQNPFEAEIELCDGWYPIRTVLDYPLTEAVLGGRIVVGTKLMIQGAELLNLNEGCAPLDVPIDVRLRIHANSTRRAHWLAKLGLYQVPTSFLVSCNHIADRGGLVVRLQLVVVRVYPLMYVDKSQGSSVLRSGRVERRRNLASDANRFDNFQKLCSQVQKELESERTAAKAAFRNARMTVTRSTTTAELLEMAEAGLDLSYIEYDLSATQRDALVNYQRRKQEEFAQEVNRRVKDLMASGSQRVIDGGASEASNRSVTPLLKVRVVDARKPEKTLMMSIWGPPEDVGEVVQERRVLEVMNLTANGSKNGEVQLKAGKNSNYRVLDRLQFNLPEGHFRRLTKISDIDQSSFQPLFNEFDTVGVVVHVGNSDTKKFQIAYLADANMNLLGVHFWSGIKEYAYEDVVKERSVLCVSNLQWRSFSQQSTIPSSYATEYTTFSEHSKSEHFNEELETLKATLENSNLNQFYQDCCAKVMSVKDKKFLRSNSFNTPLRNSTPGGTPARTLLGSCNARTPNGISPGTVGQPVSLQKRKMELLAATYRSPPKKTPIVLRRNPRAGRNFKTPMRLEEKIERALAND